MNSRSHERRKCRDVAPYIFFVFEIMIVAELIYMLTSAVTLNTWAYVILGIVTLFIVAKLFGRMMSILNRCKISKNRDKYVLQASMLH